jgi:hypothetical protein
MSGGIRFAAPALHVLAQLNYMDEDSFEYRDELAVPMQVLIRKLLEGVLDA